MSEQAASPSSEPPLSEVNSPAEQMQDSVLLKKVFEAALMSSQEPLSMGELKKLSDVSLDSRQIEALLQQLIDKYADSGIELNRVASGWRFRARPELQSYIAR
ncbi:MAG: SMC-Scp complex subunit ScpB, partial [Gallionellaceae bacterium]